MFHVNRLNFRMAAKIPIVFSPGYDITMMGLERLHPFDSAKYGKVFRLLKERNILDGRNHHVPKAIGTEGLLRVHGKEYLGFLRDSQIVAAIAEVPILRRVPNFLLQKRLLKPMRKATAGSILAAELALEHGWAINLAGGYHHAKGDSSSGFCFFADINLAAYALLDRGAVKKVLVVDLDAHQGNGFEAVFADDPRVVTFDVYNGSIYPKDLPAAAFIKYKFPLKPGTSTERYLDLLRKELPAALDAEQPDLLIYNAGVDIYEHDPLGELGVSEAGIKERDRFVFSEAQKRGIPIVMLLSGGYTSESYRIIGESIADLIGSLGLLEDKSAGAAPLA